MIVENVFLHLKHTERLATILEPGQPWVGWVEENSVEEGKSFEVYEL